MKTRVPRLFFGAFALGSIVLLAQNVQSQVLYSDTNTSQNGNFNYFPSEAGNEVSLYGTSPTYLITNFLFQFDFTGTGSPNGNEKADLRFYAMNGPTIDANLPSSAGYPSPGTLLFDSGPFSIGPFTTGTTAIFNQAALNGGVVVPWDFTWTVTFTGLTGSENAGLALYSPATIGTNYNDAWTRSTNTANWGLSVATFGNEPLDFAAIATGSTFTEAYSPANATGITINNNTINSGKAVNGYPSTITVPTNIAGTLQKATVTLNGFTHGSPNDVVLLLVAPNGNAVALMGNAGGNVAVNNFTLTFDDDPAIKNAAVASVALPLTNGWTYRSGDNAAYGTTLAFPAPAPVTNKPNLTAFNNLAPAAYAGVWSLYVLDDAQFNTGSIASWSLNLFTVPSAIQVTNTSVTFSENQSTNFYFTVSDSSSNATFLPTITLSGVVNGNTGYGNSSGLFIDFISNSVTTVSPAPCFLFNGNTNINPNGTNVVTIKPNPNLYGTANFVINLTDGEGATVSSQPISLTVTHVPIAPVMTMTNSSMSMGNEQALSGGPIPYYMSMISLDGNGGGNMSFSVQAQNTNLLNNVAVGATVFTNNSSLNRNTNTFSFNIVPDGFPVGANLLNFIATDNGDNLSVTNTFTVTVTALTQSVPSGTLVGPLVATNTNGMVFPSHQSNLLSQISFTNLTGLGQVGRVTVSVNGLTNITPNGLGLWLFAPDGTSVPLLGTGSANSGLSTYSQLTFTDVAGGNGTGNAHDSLPQGIQLSSYSLNAVGGANALQNALQGHSLTNNGVSPVTGLTSNVWSLYVSNNSPNQIGIAGGWVLDVYPAPLVQEVAQGPSFTISESGSTNVVFVTSDTIGYRSNMTAAVPATPYPYSGTALATSLVQVDTAFSAVINGTNYTVGSLTVQGTNYMTNIVTLTGNYNETGGPLAIPVTATSTNGASKATPITFSGSSSIYLTVNFVPQPPAISYIPNQFTYAGSAILNLPFVVSSPDTNASALSVTVSSGNQGLLPTGYPQNNIVLTPGASTVLPPPSPSTQTYYLSMFPLGIKGGQSQITITVSDGVNTVTSQFLVVVGAPGSPLFYNPTPFGITNNITLGGLYPSTNLVTGLLGTVENVVVTLFDVSETNASGLSLLLVGPANAANQSSNVYLLGGAGGPTVGLTNANLIFSNSLSGPDTGAVFPPLSGQIPSTNIYQPTNYVTGAYTTAAPSPAPAPPPAYSSNLVTSFSGINPNGFWYLYAFDTNNGKGSQIAGGWQLSIITAPTISLVTNTYYMSETPGNITTNIVIQVGDAEAANTTFTVTNKVTALGFSSTASITVVTNDLVTNNGTANLAVLQVTPNAYQFGTNNIQIVARDVSGNISTANVTFIVNQAPQLPIILVTNVAFSTPAAVPTNGIPLAVWDVQTINANTISVSSQGLIPAPNITVITNGAAVLGTNSYSLNIQPVGVGTGTATINVSVTDGIGQTAKTNFTLTVTPNLAYASSGAITLGPGYPYQALASPYPSPITVPGSVVGVVSGVQVQLLGLTHNDASDVDVLLVSPDGQHSVVLMANAGNGLPANNVNLLFSQSAGGLIPLASQLASGTFLPANYVPSLVFTNPAPATGYSENLNTAFAGLSPVGTWNLYVMDSAFQDSGTIAGWILFLQTGPSLAAIPNQGVRENGTNIVPITIADSTTPASLLTVSVVNTNSSVTVTPQGTGTTAGVTNLLIVPAPNYPSTNQNNNSTNFISVTVSDNATPTPNTATTSFTLIVTNVFQPPVIVSATTNGAACANLQIPENGSAIITFAVSNVDAYLTTNTLSLIATNAVLVPATNISTNAALFNTAGQSYLLPGALGTISYTVTPAANVFGTNNPGGLVFTIYNTNNVTNTLSIGLSISHVVQPPSTVVGAGPYLVFPGSSTNIPFSATTVESNATLTITASSATPAEVPNSPQNIIISPASFSNSAALVTNLGTIKIIVPAGAPVGTSVIYVTNTQVASGTTSTNSVTPSFTIQVLASPTASFAGVGTSNSAASPLGSPYPSTITVPATVAGNVYSAAVTLNAFNASVPNDVTILLQPPNGGGSVLLLSGAGGTNGATNLTLTFADTNNVASPTAALAANNGAAALHPTTYNGLNTPLPTNNNPPTPPFFDQLAVLNGINPVGTWSLWMVDKTTGDTASMSSWTLSLSTTPQIVLDTNPPPPQLSVFENAVGQNNQGTVTFHVVDATGAANSDTINITTTPSSMFATPTWVTNTSGTSFFNDYTATFIPTPAVSGTGTLNFTVTRAGGATSTTTYPVLVVASNIPPGITRLITVITNENQTGQTEFFVTQYGDPLADATVAVYSSNTTLVPNGNITFLTGPTTPNPGTVSNMNVVNLAGFGSTVVPSAGDLILRLQPGFNQVGTALIAVFATNIDALGTTVSSNTFNFTVSANAFTPTFANTPTSPISLVGGNTSNISFQVNSLDATPPLITVTASSGAPAVVTTGTITSSSGLGAVNIPGATWTVPIIAALTSSPVPPTTIQLTATDANGQIAITNFQVVVVPSLQHVYSNPNGINIVDVSPSQPSPSPIPVSGLVGTISQVIVSINGFGHQYPSDVGMLVVGPNGANTVLMNNAGDGANVAGLTLVFSSNAVAPVPATQALTSGTYLPSDYQAKPYNFLTSGPNNPTPPNPLPPSGPYATNLATFNGLSPNTTWYLYVQDDSAGDTGLLVNGQGVTNGWTLQITTQPGIQFTGLTSITNSEASPNGKTAFNILDDSAVGAASYVTNSFSVTSSNTTLIPTANVTFTEGATSTNWTAFFSPTLNVTGSSLITISATNSYGQVASGSFLVTVTPVNVPPVIVQPASGSVITILAGTPTIIPLLYSDIGFNTNALIVSATSVPVPAGSQSPVPTSSLSFVAGAGTGPSNLFVVPVGTLTGTNSITLTVTQPGPGTNLLSTNSTFTVVVVPGTVPVFAKTNAITINANAPATPYPSQITVSGVSGNIYKVTVNLIGFSHTFPSDVSALLVGPGANVMLMSLEGGDVAVSNLNLTFNDSGLAMAANGPLTNGTYAPAGSDWNYSHIPSLPDITNYASLFPPPYAHALSAFSNANPNGLWSLYVFDINQPDTGLISGGWSLSIQTIGPMVTPLSPVTINENSSITIPYSISSASTYASNVTPAWTANSQVPLNLVASLAPAGLGTTNQTLTITPTVNYPSAVTNINGSATITLVLTDTNHNSSTNSFPLTVLYSNIPPIIALPVTQTNTPANVVLTVPFTATDVEGVSNLALSASLSTNVGTVLVTTNSVGSYAVTFTPNGVTGQAIVSVIASDHGAASSQGAALATNTFQLTVSAGLPPTITTVSATNTPENSTLSVPLALGNVAATFSSLNLSGTFSNTNLVASLNFTGVGSNFIANITLVPFTTGASTIGVTMTNQFGSATTSFSLTVTPVEYPPTLAHIPDTNTTVNTPVSVVLNVTDFTTAITNLIYTAGISSTNVIAAVNFSFNGTNEVATVVPVTNATGASAVTINVSDGVASASQTFAVTVLKVEIPPTLAPIGNISTTANTPVNVVLNVADSATSITNLSYSAAISATNVIAAVRFSFNGTNEVATMVPVTNQTGSSAITINVSDGYTNVYQSFVILVSAPTPPILGAITNRVVLLNTVVQVPLNVSSPVTPVTNLQFSGISSNASLVKSFAFSFNGTNEVATITPNTNASGLGTITISVNDPFSTNSQSFTLQIDPAVLPTLATAFSQNILSISFTGVPGAVYNIVSSPSLTNQIWTKIATVTANPVTGAVQYNVTIPAGAGHTYYRLESP